MDNNENFNTIDDLYKRLLPALRAKSEELKRQKILVSTLDIWNFCVNVIWKNKSNLRLYDLVDDIFEIDSIKLQVYCSKN